METDRERTKLPLYGAQLGEVCRGYLAFELHFHAAQCSCFVSCVKRAVPSTPIQARKGDPAEYDPARPYALLGQ